jgi:hypothetical protein
VEHVGERLGHEAVTEEPTDGRIDVVVLEPEGGTGLELATLLRSRLPDLPMICTSIAPPAPATQALKPRAHLIKPYALRDLSQELSAAMSRAA